MGNLRQCAFVVKGDYTRGVITLKALIPPLLKLKDHSYEKGTLQINLEGGNSGDSDDSNLAGTLKPCDIEVDLSGEGSYNVQVLFFWSYIGKKNVAPKQVGSSLLVSV